MANTKDCIYIPWFPIRMILIFSTGSPVSKSHLFRKYSIASHSVEKRVRGTVETAHSPHSWSSHVPAISTPSEFLKTVENRISIDHTFAIASGNTAGRQSDPDGS